MQTYISRVLAAHSINSREEENIQSVPWDYLIVLVKTGPMLPQVGVNLKRV